MITLTLLAILLVPVALVGGGIALLWKSRRRAVLRWSAIGYILLVLLFFAGLGPFLVVYSLTHAGSRTMDMRLKATPADFQVPYEDVVFDARDSVRLSGWFVPPRGVRAILICNHGLFRNRVEVLPRAMSLAQAGFGALLYDTRSHGASDKAMVTLGFNERNDVLGAIQYIRRRYQDSPERPLIILYGVSMGAAAILGAAQESRDYSAIILDSPYSSLRDTAIRHSWLFFKLPRYPFPGLFMFWFERQTGFSPDRFDAIKAIRQMEPVPTLIIASEGDLRMGPGAARDLIKASRSPVKRIEIFGADVSHGAAARLHPEAYAALLKDFLRDALNLEPVQGGLPPAVTSSSATEGSQR